MNDGTSDKMSMVEIQIVSDLHLESPPAYDLFDITPRAPHLALLGDIGNVSPTEHRDGLVSFLKKQLQVFRTVFFIPGNHEAYNSTWPKALFILRSFEQHIASLRTHNPALGEFVLMDRRSFRIGNFLILGCSLFSRVPDQRVSAVETSMNDFYLTGDGWSVTWHNKAHSRDLQWLNEEVSRAQEDGSVHRIVVLTHWSPSLDPRASDPKHAGSIISSGFATDLSMELCWTSEKVATWAWGHTHFNFDFVVPRQEGRKPLRVLANQRGYYFQPAEGFDPEKLVKLGWS